MIAASYRSRPESEFTAEVLSDFLPFGKTLFPYQQAAMAYFMATTKGMLCPLPPGAGKTPLAAAIAHFFDRVLVVVPPAIVTQWHRRLVEWGHPRVSVVRSNAEALSLRSVPDGVLLIPDSLIARFRPVPCDLLIVDESHRFKNRTAARSRRVLGRGGWATKATKVLLLSGSPAPNGVCDLFTTCHALGMPVGENWIGYAKQFCPDRITRFGSKTVTKNDQGTNIPLLNSLLRNGHMHKPKTEEVTAQLPPLRVDSVTVLAQVGGLDDQTIQAGFAGKLIGQEEQQFSTKRRLLGEAKGQLAVDLIRTYMDGGDRPLIWVWHRGVGQVLSQELKVPFVSGEIPQAARALLLAQFIKGQLPAMVLSIAAAGTGIDGLQHASELAIFVERDFVPSNNEQAIARIYRTGQTKPVRIINVTSPDPLDRALERILARKSSESEQVQA